MFIRITDPVSNNDNNKRGRGGNLLSYLFSVFNPKIVLIVLRLSVIWGWEKPDPGSGSAKLIVG
jgi:hypothetical protein